MITKNSLFIKNFYLESAFCLVLTLLFFIVAEQAHGAANIDPAFNPLLTKDVTSSYSGNFTLQPDGKIIVFGTFQAGGTYLKRFNTDGTTDTSFDGSITNTMNVYSAAALSSGKIMVAGFTDVPKIFRLNSDGSVDGTYNAVFPSGNLESVWEIEVLAVQPDGKILVRRRSSWQGYTLQEIFRLNADGSNDSGFTRLGLGPLRFSQAVYSKIAVLPDGKLLIARTIYGSISSTADLNRHNPDGTQDTTFEKPTFGASGTPTSASYFDVSPDGSIIVSGNFTTVNSIPKTDVVRLLPVGNVDLNFFPDSLFDQSGISAGRVAILPGGQFLVNTVVSGGGNRLYRFNSNGSLDNTYNPPVSLTLILNWILDGSSRVLGLGELSGALKYLRLNTDATLDTSFNPAITKSGTTSTLAVQADGKILVNGDYDRVNGTAKLNFSRINPDGTLDPTFNAGSGFDIAPNALVLQPDGKILAIGNFTTYNGTSRLPIARINSDGSLDSSFSPDFSGSVRAVAPLANGKILVGGGFATVNGISQRALAQLNSDGSLDTSFSPIFGGSGSSISAIIVLADGKIMVGGSFSAINGFNRSNFVRLNADGTLDSTFNAGTISPITQLTRQPDGKYLMRLDSTISRRNADGSADASFQSPNFNSGTVSTTFLQSDGNILVGGSFSFPNHNVARFLPNGAFDPAFLPTGANSPVYAIAGQADGKILIGGNFFTIGDVTRSGIARISFTIAQPRTLFDFDGDAKADVSVFRPSENKWYVLRSSDLGVTQQVFAIAGDVPVPADYDGDGKTDFAIFRPSSGDWWSLSSSNGAQIYAHWGTTGDIPRPSDFDGDGRTDYVVFRPSSSFWYRISSGNGATSNAAFGLSGDKPVTGDFDGDGKSDKAIFRPSTGDWWYHSSLNGAQLAVHWGISTDIPAPADFDGDGKTDFAVYRPSTGVWYIINSSNGSFTIMNFGISEDKPVPADYDGDGKADIAVFRPSTGAWYLQRSTAGFWGLSFGISTDIPVENAFVP